MSFVDLNRRAFMGVAGSAAGALVRAASPEVKKVLVLFKCHFDLGFINTQATIMHLYFEHHFPQAIATAAAMRETGSTPYIWTTGSWLLYEYLEQANFSERSRMEKAIEAGDIAWHALPYSWQSEFMDRSSIVAMIGLSRDLDRRYGRHTTGAKMTDVPGHTRGLIGPLVEGGVTFLDIGVNAASTPPDVPSLFRWKDVDGASLTTMYHRTDYGGVVEVPGQNLVVAVEVKNDNEGPHSPAEIQAIYRSLRTTYPSAIIQAANLTDIAAAVAPSSESLPVITQEIGDTWIYGVPSDPVKVARYRELQRLRRDWIAQVKFKVGDTTDLKFCRNFCLAAEHTWGTDTKTWLDFDTYLPDALASKLDDPKYKTVENSWMEKRENINAAVHSLPTALREEANSRLSSLVPVQAAVFGQLASTPVEPIEGKHFTILQDQRTGALVRLKSKSTGHEWASIDNPLALFSYQTLSQTDYDRFLSAYITLQTDWAPKDFGKPNIGKFGAQSKIHFPTVSGHRIQSNEEQLVLQSWLRFRASDQSSATQEGWPEDLYQQIILPNAEPVVHIELSWMHKRPTRMPEALWMTFQPPFADGTHWILDKLERPVSALDVVAGGNRRMHAITRGITCQGGKNSLLIESLDAPVVALGTRSPIAFSRAQPDLKDGIHFSLFNNAWGTNYIQWFGEPMKFRFSLYDLRH